MSDMYGAIRSNVFRVKDVAAFKEWFTAECYFGEEIELWEDDEGVSFGGYEMYPSAYPRMVTEDADEIDEVHPEWDLDRFAEEFSAHLIEGEALVVVSGGNEKLRYVAAERLFVDSIGRVTFDSWYAGN
jgi:hypothetical protein